ncbi:RNA exonuclease 1-like [Daphnia pulicaria]|uniref:RNA exonuclease 1-like n=1 Tax=Daphnia pulicaria TaxID=35523 RepID=UPI001EEA598F|nr:RNA exonuclease 1-like [Daphnia pulicaria]
MFAVKVDQPAEKKPRLDEEDFQALKDKLKARKKIFKNFPLFKIIESGTSASVSTPKDSRIPISVKDVQDLILLSVSGEVRHLNRWFLLTQWQKISQTAVLVLENVSVNDIENNQDLFPRTLGIFEDGVELLNSNNAGLSLSVALAYSPITHMLKSRIPKVYTSLKEALDNGHIFSITDFTEESYQEKDTSGDDSKKQDQTEMNGHTKGCSKPELMLNALQLITGYYPFPGHGRAKEFVFTKDRYEPVTENSPMFAIDCEWCLCVDGTNGLARVAIVDENLDPVYHAYVLPEKPVRDYATKWSGITPALLRGIQKRLFDVQQDIRKLLPPDAILVGHCLRGDLLALELFHPYIIDSAVIYNMTGCRHMKSKLQFLSKVFCDRDIQSLDRMGHDPNEDASASMELVLLKMGKGLKYGDSCSGGCWDGPSKEKILSVMSDSIFHSRNKSESELDLQDVLLMKFFTFVQSLDKSTVLITQPTYDKIYRPKTPLHSGLFGNVKADSVEIVPETKLQNIVPTLESRMNKDLLYVHMSVADEEKKGNEHLKILDDVIADVYDKLAMRGIMIVIFGGKSNPMENGMCMIRVKKPCREDLLRDHFPNQ